MSLIAEPIATKFARLTRLGQNYLLGKTKILKNLIKNVIDLINS